MYVPKYGCCSGSAHFPFYGSHEFPLPTYVATDNLRYNINYVNI